MKYGILTLVMISFLNVKIMAMGKRPSKSIDNEYVDSELKDDSLCKNLKTYAKNAKWNLTNPSKQHAEQIVVDKSRRLIHLLVNNNVIRTYKTALGNNPVGPKRAEGDGKTPEGRYIIEYKNSASDFYLSLKVSYPNESDREYAKKHGFNPGGAIMVHGFPNNKFKRFFVKSIHPNDWTKGCMAVTNNEIYQMWQLVKSNTPIEICK